MAGWGRVFSHVASTDESGRPIWDKSVRMSWHADTVAKIYDDPLVVVTKERSFSDVRNLSRIGIFLPNNRYVTVGMSLAPVQEAIAPIPLRMQPHRQRLLQQNWCARWGQFFFVRRVGMPSVWRRLAIVDRNTPPRLRCENRTKSLQVIFYGTGERFICNFSRSRRESVSSSYNVLMQINLSGYSNILYGFCHRLLRSVKSYSFIQLLCSRFITVAFQCVSKAPICLLPGWQGIRPRASPSNPVIFYHLHPASILLLYTCFIFPTYTSRTYTPVVSGFERFDPIRALCITVSRRFSIAEHVDNLLAALTVFYVLLFCMPVHFFDRGVPVIILKYILFWTTCPIHRLGSD